LDYDSKVEPWSYYTPTKEYADFTLLNSLPDAKINLEHSFVVLDEKQKVACKLENVSGHLAFFIELNVSGRNSGRTILPIFWEDNYISLLPGETRNVEAVFAATDDEPVLTISGWNSQAHYL